MASKNKNACLDCLYFEIIDGFTYCSKGDNPRWKYSYLDACEDFKSTDETKVILDEYLIS